MKQIARLPGIRTLSVKLHPLRLAVILGDGDEQEIRLRASQARTIGATLFLLGQHESECGRNRLRIEATR